MGGVWGDGWSVGVVCGRCCFGFVLAVAASGSAWIAYWYVEAAGSGPC